MVFNDTFNTISAISWRSVYWRREPGDPEKTTDLSQVIDKFYHIMVYISPWSRFELTISVVIGTDGIDSYKSNCHTIGAVMLSRMLTCPDTESHVLSPSYGRFRIMYFRLKCSKTKVQMSRSHNWKERHYNGQQEKAIEWSTGKDNTMFNRKRQDNGQQKKTIKCSTEKDNTMVNRKRQYNVQLKKTIQWSTEK
jgi:hypothetical protein